MKHSLVNSELQTEAEIKYQKNITDPWAMIFSARSLTTFQDSKICYKRFTLIVIHFTPGIMPIVSGVPFQKNFVKFFQPINLKLKMFFRSMTMEDLLYSLTIRIPFCIKGHYGSIDQRRMR